MSVEVSIVVPVYNVEKYLPQCLESILNQTFQNFEIIVVNDGSTDESERIIQQYSLKYPNKIRAFSQENQGVAATRNLALKYARGKYISFVDSDDFVGTDFIKDLYEVARLKNADMVICNYTKVDEQGKKMRVYNANFKEGELRIPSYISCNRLIKKELFNTYQICYKKGIVFEDIPVMLKMEAVAENVQLISKADYFYRSNPQSITNSFNKKKYEMNQLPFEAMKESIEFCMEQGHGFNYEKLEFFVCRIWTSVLFDMGRKCDKKTQKMMCKEVQMIMEEYFPVCYRNLYVSLGRLKKISKVQKIGTWLFVKAYHMNMLYVLLRVCSII